MQLCGHLTPPCLPLHTAHVSLFPRLPAAAPGLQHQLGPLVAWRADASLITGILPLTVGNGLPVHGQRSSRACCVMQCLAWSRLLVPSAPYPSTTSRHIRYRFIVCMCYKTRSACCARCQSDYLLVCPIILPVYALALCGRQSAPPASFLLPVFK